VNKSPEDDDTEQMLDGHATRALKDPRIARVLGPGLISGASDDDPSGIGTYSQTGAAFGYQLGWTMLLTFPLMCAVQIASARLGRSTGHGIAGNLARNYPAWLLHGLVGLLLIANIINIGADLGAMADATRLLLSGPHILYVVGFALIVATLEIFISYKRYARILKWLTLALLAYVATLFLADVDWGSAFRGLVMPSLVWDAAVITTIVAILGTTISPYLFFWQASEEVEDIEANARRSPLHDHPEQGPAAIERIEIDTIVGMGLSNIIALAIILTTAATLHQQGITDIETSAQAAEALRPVAGQFASAIFAAGIVGTGLLAVPVLAGSAAYALGESRRWPVGLDRKPREARAFYSTIAIATIIGASINFLPINPVKALYWAAVVNGVVAVPVMGVMMLMTGQHKIMGKWVLGRGLRALGWLSTAVMAACVIAMFATMLL
jgi:NRAMP (natural resistance-associated macrophage protein)-like metal ion transporter